MLLVTHCRMQSALINTGLLYKSVTHTYILENFDRMRFCAYYNLISGGDAPISLFSHLSQFRKTGSLKYGRVELIIVCTYISCIYD
jgi:hypothetical protein